MIKKIIYSVIIFIALLYYFDKKGWINITPEGKKKAINIIRQWVKFGKEVTEDVQEEINRED